MSKLTDSVKVGNKYHEWTVIGKADRELYWKCRCSCGIEREVYVYSLTGGKSLSCGHISKMNIKRPDEKYIGKRFGRLTVIKRVNETGPSKYLCKCDCGNEIISKGCYLGKGVNSCGCLKRELNQEAMDKIKDEGAVLMDKARVEKTNLYSITTKKLSKNNTSGYTGVSRQKNGTYRAYINLRRKQIYLGEYDKIEDAIAARKAGEEKYYDPILEKHKDWVESEKKRRKNKKE